MSFTFYLALLLLGVLVLGTLASVLAPRKATEPPTPIRGGLPPLVVGACTVPVAAFVFYLATGYPILEQLLPGNTVSTLFIVLHIAAPLAAGAVCLGYYFRLGHRLRFFLLAWLMLVLSAIGTGAWSLGGM